MVSKGFRQFVFGVLVMLTLSSLVPNKDIASADYPTLKMSIQQIEAVLKTRLQEPLVEKANALAHHITWLAAYYQFDPAVILSVIHAESSFRTDAVSPVGAVGLMQLLPSTARYFAKKKGFGFYKTAWDLRDPFVNTTLGVSYLAYLRERFQEASRYFAAYNLGPTTVGRMVRKNRFRLGKVKKYVHGIQNEIENFRQTGIQLASAASANQAF